MKEPSSQQPLKNPLMEQLRKSTPKEVKDEIDESFKRADPFSPDKASQQQAEEKLYTQQQVMDALRANLIKNFGGLSHDEQGDNLSTPYITIGIMNDVFNDLNQ